MPNGEVANIKGDNKSQAIFYCMLSAARSGCECEVCTILRTHVDEMMKDLKGGVGSGKPKAKRKS